METRPPTFGRIAIAAGFALSCFGLLLFLWLAFGGPIPLKSKSYRVDIHFDEASQLAVESDVRISGVSVGKVKGIELADDGLADATIEIEPKYAPIPSNTKAILRQKTLLGETYVELTPGDEGAPALPEGGTLATAQVSDAVQLDEIFRAFDEPTRAAFQAWMADAAVAFRGRGVDLNAALGNLDPFAERADDLLRVLDSQDLAVKKLLADGGATFDAISRQPGELRSLIENTESVFSTTAARDAELRELFQVLPTFLDESKLTLERLDRFAGDTDALVTQLRPVARQLSGTFVALKRLSPELKRFFTGLRPVIQRAEPGFSSLRAVLDDELPPFLGRLDPYFDQLIPVFDTIDRYKKEVTAFLANTSSALNGESIPNLQTKPVKFIRATGPLGPAVLASPPSPYEISRFNAYVKQGGYTKLAQGLDSFFTAHCSGGLTATLEQGDFSADLYERTQLYAMGGLGITSTDDVATPPCRQQGQVSSIGGPPDERTYFPHVNAEP
ncbi:MAG TPA: MlaD family protein [Solirubrobacterales bacterium]|nr:MlaD family protein [Solirubrobacterales bacterium]